MYHNNIITDLRGGVHIVGFTIPDHESTKYLVVTTN